MDILAHWQYDTSRAAKAKRLPEGTDVVLVVRDMISHSKFDKVVAIARRDKVPHVCGTRKWSETRPLLLRAGLLPVIQVHRPAQALPVVAAPAPAPVPAVVPEAPRPRRARRTKGSLRADLDAALELVRDAMFAMRLTSMEMTIGRGGAGTVHLR